MKKIAIFLALCIGLLAIQDATAAKRKRKTRARTHRVVKAKKPVKLSLHDIDPFRTCEDTCSHVHGIDVSHYQNDVFWQSIGDETNMAYVYLKATEGTDNVDSHFVHNINLAHQYGLKVGSYHFFRPKLDLRQQVENFREWCCPSEQDLIPMLDVETTGGLSTKAFCDSLTKMLNIMEDVFHQKPLVYTYRNFYNQHMMGQVDDYQLMIATYADEQPVLNDGRDYIIWQYTCKGRLSGVKGEVDKSRIMGDHTLSELRYQR